MGISMVDKYHCPELRVQKSASFAWRASPEIPVLAGQVLVGRKVAEPVISPRLSDIRQVEDIEVRLSRSGREEEMPPTPPTPKKREFSILC